MWENTVAYFSVKWIENVLQKCIVQEHKEKWKLFTRNKVEWDK